MPQWPWQAQPARKRSRTPSESEAGEALHFEDSDFYEHQSSAGPQQVQVTDETINEGWVKGVEGGQSIPRSMFDMHTAKQRMGFQDSGLFFYGPFW